jgi:rubredoxin
VIVGCYSLDLYCMNYLAAEGPDPVEGRCPTERADQFEGRNGRDAKAAARRKGWRFMKGDALCPDCIAGLPGGAE